MQIHWSGSYPCLGFKGPVLGPVEDRFQDRDWTGMRPDHFMVLDGPVLAIGPGPREWEDRDRFVRTDQDRPGLVLQRSSSVCYHLT